jgi:hypothetical protein
MSKLLITTTKTTSTAHAFSSRWQTRLWTTTAKFMNGLCATRGNHANNLWMTSLTLLNSLCTTRQATSNNFVQLKNQVFSSAQSPVEQRVEQPVLNHLQQHSNKPSKVVYGTRTVFEQLFKPPYLFKTTNVNSSALTPSCASRKPLKHNSFSTLSTIY